MKRVLIFFIGCLLLLNTQCHDDYETIPYVYENLILGKNTDLMRLNPGMKAIIQKNSSGLAVISFPGQTATVTTNQELHGNGIILYKDPISYDIKAYKLTCTYNPKEYNKLTYDGTYFVCSKCGSKFLIESEGYPTGTSKAGRPLETYPIIDDDGYIKIYY